MNLEISVIAQSYTCSVPAGIYLLKVKNGNTRVMCSKLNLFKVNNEDTKTMLMTSFWSTLNRFHIGCSGVSFLTPSILTG